MAHVTEGLLEHELFRCETRSVPRDPDAVYTRVFLQAFDNDPGVIFLTLVSQVPDPSGVALTARLPIDQLVEHYRDIWAAYEHASFSVYTPIIT